MPMSSFLDSPVFTWGILPLLIFLARIMDVSIGTIRIMLLSRDKKFLAPVLAFFEVLIWLLAIRQIFNHLTNIACYFAFAGGFAMGNFVGIILEEKLAMGLEVVRVITKKDGTELVEFLKTRGYGVTSVDAQGTTGKVNIIYTIISRKDHRTVIDIIHQFNPRAFYSVEDVKSVSEGVFPIPENHTRKLFNGKRKGK
ncbi:MAG TPA: DUF2179 domain-containing protein [Candidatus Omnitrophota bacterium]|jgi:uncharacterized protein YebE (UPF0316 family)|nr:DUF2179 domain-containing protein [Candidatus Omnitrophota bacterium]